jgi:hypothetical protein
MLMINLVSAYGVFGVFGLYTIFVLVPMLVSGLVEHALGIDAYFQRIFIDAVLPLHLNLDFKDFVHTVLFFPLLEEVVFRAVPLTLLGVPGLIIGSIVWVSMHPAWQLDYLATAELGTKASFMILDLMFYGLSAVFYGILWVTGAGLIAILIHMFHNAWVTIASRHSTATIYTQSRFVKHR